MRLFIPEDKISRAPQWWSSERYDYCDVVMEKDTKGNLFKKFIGIVSQLFA